MVAFLLTWSLLVEFSDFLNPILRSLFIQKYITLNYTFIIFVSYFIFYSGSVILVVQSVLADYLSNICLFPLNVCLLLLNVLCLSVCHHNLFKKLTILSKPCWARCWEFGGAVTSTSWECIAWDMQSFPEWQAGILF